MPAAERHEALLLWASNPALYLLLRAGRVLGPARRVPRLGWVVSDPVLVRRLLTDDDHVSMLGEGGVGHLWAQVLGDWVNDTFDGPGHAALRAKGRDLFTDASAKRQVLRVFAEAGPGLTGQLQDGRDVDIADLARVWVGRMVADLLGVDVPAESGDAWYRSIFKSGERLTALARHTMSSTVLSAPVLRRRTSSNA